MKKRLAAMKEHFDRHRFAYGVITACAIIGYFNFQRAEEWNAFLKEHNLFDEFYSFED